MNIIENISDYSTMNTTAAHSKMSEKYAFVPTQRMVSILGDYGWSPIRIQQKRVRDESREGFQTHIIRLRTHDTLNKAQGEYVPEIVLKNSHEGSSSFQLMLGCFRIVCTNGLISGDAFTTQRIRHAGFAEDKAEQAIRALLNESPRLIESIETMRSTVLSQDESLAYAKAAIELKFDGDAFSVKPEQLLQTRRFADREALPTVWGTFNVVQEHMVKGGLRGTKADGSRRYDRAVKSIDKNVTLNKALWTLAEEMTRLKMAA